tara:strand:- start:2149 stop:3144 length:996 start_codon:yes stop_codon:yes gene_type:complete
MKSAVIGLGWWGKQIIKCLDESKKINITHAFDPQVEPDDEIFKKYNVNPELEFDGILKNAEIEALILATPNQFHEHQVIAAANSGKQVFCEKPVALKYESILKMAEACKDNNIILGVGHERRWEPAMVRLKKMLDNNELGKILHMETNFSHDIFMKLDKNSWRLDPKYAPAGGMTALGIHLTDFFVSFLGQAEKLYAKTESIALEAPKKDTLSVNIRFKNKVTASLAVMISTPFYGRFNVFGEKGWVEIREISNVDFDDPSEFIYCDNEGKRITKEYNVVNTVKMNFEEWADAIKGKCEYRIKIDEVISNVQILESIINSSENNQVIEIKD